MQFLSVHSISTGLIIMICIIVNILCIYVFDNLYNAGVKMYNYIILYYDRII